MGGLTGIDALALFLRCIERNTADSSLGFFLDTLLGLCRAIPMTLQETAFLNLYLKLLPTVALTSMFEAELERFLIDIILSETCSYCKEVYILALKKDPGIGIATVYRMVDALEKIGL